METAKNLERTEPRCCTEILEEFESKEPFQRGALMEFTGVGNRDVYNISQPFEIENRTVIAGRVEKREDWAKSKVAFFEQTGDFTWNAIKEAPILPLEDPFVTTIGGETILGGVEVYTTKNEFNSNEIGYRTVFYKGKKLSDLKRFAQGPDRMKDIRLVELPNGKIGVCTRPQGGEHGRGQIGYMTISRLEEINEETLLSARVIGNLFKSDQWGGANQLFVLKNGEIGVLGHIAYEDGLGYKHYYAVSFTYNPLSHEYSPMKIIATRKCFPPGEAKKPQLGNVHFPGGLKRENGHFVVYGGLSDAQSGFKPIPDPFENF
jgi:predicted GH43/DUF377 family glycosyl hydrolase